MAKVLIKQFYCRQVTVGLALSYFSCLVNIICPIKFICIILAEVEKLKNAIFAKSANFAPGGFQCTAKSIFIPTHSKLGKISTKKAHKKSIFYYFLKFNISVT